MAYRYPSITETTYLGVWSQVRDHYGPRPTSMSNEDMTTRYGKDLTSFTDWLDSWNIEHSDTKISTPALFSKWLIWKCNNGTDNYGNLATRDRDHVGIKGVLCPFDSRVAVYRAIDILGYLPNEQVDHINNYMKVTQKGAVWGFECTYSDCSYKINTGSYFFCE